MLTADFWILLLVVFLMIIFTTEPKSIKTGYITKTDAELAAKFNKIWYSVVILCFSLAFILIYTILKVSG